MEMSGSASDIHVHCRTVRSVLVNHGVRPSCSLGGSTYPQKKKKNGHSPYNVSVLFYETWVCCLTIFIRYFRGLTLFSIYTYNEWCCLMI